MLVTMKNLEYALEECSLAFSGKHLWAPISFSRPEERQSDEGDDERRQIQVGCSQSDQGVCISSEEQVWYDYRKLAMLKLKPTQVMWFPEIHPEVSFIPGGNDTNK
jgi:hypothetical protein